MYNELYRVLRGLARRRFYSMSVISVFALGIGAAIAIFSIANRGIFRGSHFPSDVYMVGWQTHTVPFSPLTPLPVARAYEDETEAFAGWAESIPESGNIVVSRSPVGSLWMRVSVNFFSILNISPALGRNFLPDEYSVDDGQVAIISYGFWQHALAGEQVLGKEIIIAGKPCKIVGILGKGQILPPYLNLPVYCPQLSTPNPAVEWFTQCYLLGRLRLGAKRTDAIRMLKGVKAPISPFNIGQDVTVCRVADLTAHLDTGIYWVILIAVTILFATACLNASNLIFVKMIDDSRHYAIRFALGANRWFLVLLLGIESMVLAVIGSLFGVLVARWVLALLNIVYRDSSWARWLEWDLDRRVLCFALVLTIISGIFAAIVPAIRVLHMGAGLEGGLDNVKVGDSGGLARIRLMLAVLQVASATVLMACAGLMIHTLSVLNSENLGFDPRNRVKMRIEFPIRDFDSPQKRKTRLEEIERSLERMPGMEGVTFGTDVLLPEFPASSMSIVGRTGRSVSVNSAMLHPGYGPIAGLRLTAGKWLTEENGNNVMVNEKLAHEPWANGNAIGQVIRPVQRNKNAGKNWNGWVVIGIVGDTVASPISPARPILFCPEDWGVYSMGTYIMRIDGSRIYSNIANIRKYIYDRYPDVVIQEIQPFDQVIKSTLWRQRLADSVLKLLTVISSVLTLAGVYSFFSFLVRSRVREFGVRAAVGATPLGLIWLVLRRAIFICLWGLLVGLFCAWGLTHLISAMLYGTSPMEPLVLLWTTCGIFVIGLLGSAIPAVRVGVVNVASLLRFE